MKQTVIDWLFRFNLYRGIRVDAPKNLITVDMVRDTSMTDTYNLSVNETEVGMWLKEECEGPWTIGLRRPARERKPYVCFARVSDAVIFRIKQS